MRNFRNISAWSKSLALVTKVYVATREFPSEEKFGLISQLRRAAVSIPSNIAEGSSRNTDKDFKRFLEISIGSAFEVETQLLIAKELEYIKKEDFESLLLDLHEIQKMINGFISKLKAIS